MSEPTHDTTFSEKEFYLEEFRGKTLLFALRAGEIQTNADANTAVEVFTTLLENETRLLLLIEATGEKEEQQRLKALGKRLVRAAKIPAVPSTVLPVGGEDDVLLTQIWEVLRSSPLCIGLWPANFEQSLVSCAQRIAVRLKVYKLVFLDSLGGIVAGGSRLSFMNGAVLQELLRQGTAEWAGLGARRPLLEAIRVALEGGVSSVTLCPLSGLARELLTYEGCGTLFTLADYCQVEHLGIDDFYEVERLMQRGVREGSLKERTPHEIGQLLLHGYGARLGSGVGELAGFCALLPYPVDRAGEIVGLYTITRFQGEGVGGRLVEQMLTEGKRQAFTYLFACTTQEGAQRLFKRHGFCRVSPENVPATKWQGYDLERKQHVVVYRRELPLLE
jgi:amino-acid N-acetyltransferase